MLPVNKFILSIAYNVQSKAKSEFKQSASMAKLRRLNQTPVPTHLLKQNGGMWCEKGWWNENAGQTYHAGDQVWHEVSCGCGTAANQNHPPLPG